jgi:hypothetical protein
MRPKKVIVLIGLPEHNASPLRLVLRVHGYEVRNSRRVSDVVRSAKRGGVDLVVSAQDAHIRKIREQSGYVPTILLSPLATASVTDANRAFCLPRLDMAELIDAIRILMYRRRGPVPQQARRAA